MLSKEMKDKIIEIWTKHKSKGYLVKGQMFNKYFNVDYNVSNLSRYYNFYMEGFKAGLEKTASETQLKRIGRAQASLLIKQKENNYARKELHKIAREKAIKNSFIQALQVPYTKEELTKSIKVLTKTDNKNTRPIMLVINSDLQIGREVKVKHNVFNVNVLDKRQEKFLNEVKYYADIYGVKDFIHLDMGDAIDHNAMRLGHHNDLEPNMLSINSQFKKWFTLRIETLKFLGKLGKVSFAGVPSNHCRVNGNKLLNHPLDDWSVFHNSAIEGILPNSQYPLKAIDYKNGIYLMKVGGKDIYLSHSDKLPGKPNSHKNTWVNHIRNNYGVNKIDLLITGHYHHYFQNDNHLGVGSIVGSDDYALKLGLGARPSQVIVIIDKDRIISIPIFLDKEK